MSNIHSIFTCIKNNSPLSKRDLQEKTGLSWGVISSVTSTLCDNRYVILTGKQETRVGRKPFELGINTDEHLIIGIDLHISSLRGVVTDLKGRPVKEWLRLFSETEYTSVLNMLLGLLDEITKEFAARHIMGIGLAVQGVVDSEKGISIWLPHVQGWKSVPLASIIEERYHYPTYIMHDPDCIMIAEQALGSVHMRMVENAVLLRIDEGIGMSMLINRSIYTGTDGKAGEIGHVSVNRNGPVCVCGKQGCLEQYASSSGIVQRYYEAHDAENSSSALLNDTECDCQSIASAARSGDKLCIGLFEQMGEYLGYAIAVLMNIINAELIVIYGCMSEYRDLFGEKMNEQLNRFIHNGITVKIHFSDMGMNAAAQGIALAMADRTIAALSEELSNS